MPGVYTPYNENNGQCNAPSLSHDCLFLPSTALTNYLSFYRGEEEENEWQVSTFICALFSNLVSCVVYLVLDIPPQGNVSHLLLPCLTLSFAFYQFWLATATVVQLFLNFSSFLFFYFEPDSASLFFFFFAVFFCQSFRPRVHGRFHFLQILTVLKHSSPGHFLFTFSSHHFGSPILVTFANWIVH